MSVIVRAWWFIRNHICCVTVECLRLKKSGEQFYDEWTLEDSASKTHLWSLQRWRRQDSFWSQRRTFTIRWQPAWWHSSQWLKTIQKHHQNMLASLKSHKTVGATTLEHKVKGQICSSCEERSSKNTISFKKNMLPAPWKPARLHRACS